jgi:glycosyltransferase involved in cell wall biosynthesis
MEYDSIYAFHHNPIDLNIGAGIRTINLLKILSRLFAIPVNLYTIDNNEAERSLEGIIERHMKKPLLLHLVKSGYLCMFPFLIRRMLLPELHTLNAGIFVFETPFMGYAVLKNLSPTHDSLVIYNAHNVEANYWKPYLSGSVIGRILWKKVKEVERYIVEKSDYVLVASEEEIDIFQKEYSVDRKKLLLAPNGVDTSIIQPLDETQQRVNLEKMGLDSSKCVIFMGSAVKANIDASMWIITNLAPLLPDMTFLIVGSVCKYLHKIPANVKCLGVLPTDEKNRLLCSVGAAINPVILGAGTNLKMLEYLAAGLPVVTTYVGSRGLRLTDRKDAIIVPELNNFHQHLAEVFDDPELRVTLSKNARIKAEEFDWKKIESSLDRLIEQRNSAA